MADCLQFTMLSKIEHTIESSTHGYVSGIVMCCSECSECLALDVFHHAGVRIVLLLRLAEEPVHTVAYTRRDVDVFEQGEVRKTNLEGVSHTILEFIKESRLIEL